MSLDRFSVQARLARCVPSADKNNVNKETLEEAGFSIDLAQLATATSSLAEDDDRERSSDELAARERSGQPDGSEWD